MKPKLGLTQNVRLSEGLGLSCAKFKKSMGATFWRRLDEQAKSMLRLWYVAGS